MSLTFRIEVPTPGSMDAGFDQWEHDPNAQTSEGPIPVLTSDQDRKTNPVEEGALVGKI